MKWRIFYSDSRVFGHDDGEPCDAPVYGVIAVVQQVAYEATPQVWHQADLYWWCDGQWWGGDVLGFLDQSANRGATWVKQGRTIRAKDYGDILGAAVVLKEEWSA